jgi:hypothetical protein
MLIITQIRTASGWVGQVVFISIRHSFMLMHPLYTQLRKLLFMQFTYDISLLGKKYLNNAY